MPYVYAVAPAASQATSGSTNTEVDGLMTAVGSGRNVAWQSIFIMGKGAGLTAISGIAFRVKRWTTASTSGSAITPAPRDPGSQAAKCTAASGPTAGSGGGTYQLAIGCGAAGPGGWTAANPDSAIVLEAGSGDSLDLYNASGTASLNYECSIEIFE